MRIDRQCIVSFTNQLNILKMKALFIVIIFIVAAAASIYSFYGGFRKIQVQVSKAGGEPVVYEKVSGDYKKTAAVMDKIYYALLNEEKVETYKGFGIYYDDPKKVAKENLRSEAGCILEQKDYARMEALNKKYQLKTLPEGQFITACFPYKGKFSIIFSIAKVYPSLNKFAKANGYDENTPVMEIYDVPSGKILYRKELVQKQG
jgi:DNA gyrase inhibitor GyrI